MRTGKPPLPTHLKLLRGNPGQRALNKREPEPTPPTEPPEPPADLGPYAKEEWSRIIVEAFRLRLVTVVDIQPLAAYCDAYERWRRAREMIAAMAARDPVLQGFIVKTQSGGAAPNPLVWIAQNAARDMVRYASEFGLTPAARTRLTAVEAIGQGKFAGLLGGTYSAAD
jgi:P27 family predicted phage terminase small subunit